jgi:thiol-disulfide isomerase/thioredoxin
MNKRTLIIGGFVILGVVFVVILANSFSSDMDENGEIIGEMNQGNVSQGNQMMEETQNSIPEWYNLELTDISTGEAFKIGDFEGKPVLLESFAVWCPKCKSQQQEIKKLHDEIGDSVISVGLNTDPNEDEQLVKNYIEQNGFDWHYAVAPVEMTQLLISEFGNSIVNAPSVPVILICEDGNYRKLANGVKSSSKLKEEINKGC